MPHIVTTTDMELLAQKQKTIYGQVEILDLEDKTIDIISGTVLDGGITIDASAANRRTASLTLYVKDKSLLVGQDSKIWINNQVVIFIGFYHIRSHSIVWYNMGRYVFGDYNYRYDASSKTLTVSCVDLMSNLNGDKKGTLGERVIEINAGKGENIRNAMVSTLTQLGGIKKYLIAPIGEEYEQTIDPNTTLYPTQIPYDLEYSTGDNVYKVISDLRDLYPGYETFFDIDATFVCQKIPDGNSYPVLSADQMTHLVISEGLSNSFMKIKNATEIWGKCLETDRYATFSSYTGSGDSIQYNLTLNDYTLSDGDTIGFTPTVKNGASIKINSNSAYPVIRASEQIGDMFPEPNKEYVVRFIANKFYYLGEPQIHAYWQEDNPESPFFAEEGKIYKAVLSGGEYENIYSQDLALERAKYETLKTTRYNDNITLEMQIVPWLDANQKFEYKSKHTNETHEYIVKNISMSFKNGTMSVTGMRFYPLYPF